MVYMGVFGTGLSYLLLVLALQKMDAGTAGMWTTPLPLVSSILAYTLLHERPSIYTGVGGALVLAGLLSLSKHEDEAG
jgi:drug/metabolite transporter (DMT)-like permease